MTTDVFPYQPEDGRTGPGRWEPWMGLILDRIDLQSGSHGGDPWQGVCLNEAIALITGQKFNDQPVCVAAPYRSYGINLNDSAPDDERRNKLKEIIPQMVNTHPLDPTTLKPVKDEEIVQKNQEREKALKEVWKGLEVGTAKGWDKAFAGFKRVLLTDVQ